MPDRVLSTTEGKQAITSMKSIIQGGLLDQINSLITQGNTLSEPTIWDGQKAAMFRDNWSQISKELTEAQAKLNELSGQVDGINADIMTAGGNA